jgi:two-component system LytT family response regulator
MAEKYSCIIIDDEAKAIKLLGSKLSMLYSNIDIAGTYTSWAEALDALRKNNFDILFLDISMPQKNGMSLLKLVPEMEAEIIFVTAHSDHALNAFNFSPSGYVLKPIKDSMLVKAVDKAMERINHKRMSKKSEGSAVSALTQAKHKLNIPNNKGSDYVDIEDIIYFESVQKYTKVISRHGTFLSSYNIGKFKELVSEHSFYQVHRSYIVNLNYIKRYENTGVIIMNDNAEIPVAKTNRVDFLNCLEKR